MLSTDDVQSQSCRKVEDWIHLTNAWLSDIPPVHWLADRLGLQPVVVAGLGSGWLLMFLLWGFTGDLVFMVVGTAYPMFASFRVLEDSDASEISIWLTYWVTFASIVLAEGPFRSLLAFVPFYHILRLFFTVWLFLPSTRGAQAVYTWIVAPLLRRKRPFLDAALARSVQEFHSSSCGEKLRGVIRSAAADTLDAARDLGMEELMAKELAKAAASHLTCRLQKQGPLPSTPKTAEDVGEFSPDLPIKASVGARIRTASPRPVFAQKLGEVRYVESGELREELK